MVEVQGEILIDRPQDEVFEFVADEENEPRYNPQMRLAKKVTEGPIGVKGTETLVPSCGRVVLVNKPA